MIKYILGYDKLYMITSTGNVISKQFNYRILKNSKNILGHLKVNLYYNKKSKLHSVGRLVAAAFIGECPPNHMVNHIDGNKENNNVSNLEYVTNRENVGRGWKMKSLTSKYTGVSFDKRTKKWKASIQEKGKNKTIGRFSNEIDAFKAYAYHKKTAGNEWHPGDGYKKSSAPK